MAIRTIEVICVPCDKCEILQKMVENIIKEIALDTKMTIPYSYRHVKDLRELSKYSVNPSQTPVILINGAVEFCGQINRLLLKNKLKAAQLQG